MVDFLGSTDGVDYRDIKATKISGGRIRLPEDLPDYETVVDVTNEDTLLATKRCTEESKEVYCCLDMASSNPREFGGGYKKGSRAQEEDLCRRTNLCLAFDQVDPPVPPLGGVYCENLYILSSEEYKLYDKKEVVTSNCIMCAALRKPRLDMDADGNTSFTEDQFKITARKIHSMLAILLMKNCGLGQSL